MHHLLVESSDSAIAKLHRGESSLDLSEGLDLCALFIASWPIFYSSYKGRKCKSTSFSLLAILILFMDKTEISLINYDFSILHVKLLLVSGITKFVLWKKKQFLKERRNYSVISIDNGYFAFSDMIKSTYIFIHIDLIYKI